MTEPENLAFDVTLRPLSELSGWERNYRRGDTRKIADSIDRFGMNGALRVWKSGVVYAGNHTLEALKLLQEEGASIPRHCVATPSGEWLVPCIDITHLSESEARAFAIADNRLTETAEIDMDALNAHLAELAHFDPGLIDFTGYELPDLEEPDSTSGHGQGGGESYAARIQCPHCNEWFLESEANRG